MTAADPPPRADDKPWRFVPKMLGAAAALVAALVAQPLYSKFGGELTAYGSSANQQGSGNVNLRGGGQNDVSNGNSGNLGTDNGNQNSGNTGNLGTNNGNQNSGNTGDGSGNSSSWTAGHLNSGNFGNSANSGNSGNTTQSGNRGSGNGNSGANSGNTNSGNSQHIYNATEATAGDATVVAAAPADGKPTMGTTAIITYNVARQPNNGNHLFLVCTFVGTGTNNLFYAKEEIFGTGQGTATLRFGGSVAVSPAIVGTTRVCGMVTADTGSAAQLRTLMELDRRGITRDASGQSLNLQRRALPQGSSPIGSSVAITVRRTATE